MAHKRYSHASRARRYQGREADVQRGERDSARINAVRDERKEFLDALTPEDEQARREARESERRAAADRERREERKRLEERTDALIARLEEDREAALADMGRFMMSLPSPRQSYGRSQWTAEVSEERREAGRPAKKSPRRAGRPRMSEAERRRLNGLD